MKKILLTTVATAVLATSSAYAEANTFYVKAQTGWSKLNNIKIKGTDAKLKSNNDISFGIGAGYHVMDNVRVDLTFDHLANPKHELKVKVKNPGAAKGDAQSTKTTVKANVDTLMLNGFVDVFNITDEAKIFVGAGVGVSQLKAKLSTNKTVIKDVADKDNNKPATTEVKNALSAKAKKNYSFAYAAHVGASYKFAPSVTGELTYSFKNAGKTKKFTYKEGDKTESFKGFTYKGHNVGAGVRFDI